MAVVVSVVANASPGQRIRILIARFIGVGFIAYLLVSLPGIGDSASVLAWWWTPTALVSAFVPGLVLFAVTFLAPAAIPAVARVAAVGIPLASVLWLVAWDGEALDGAVRGTWLAAFAGLAGLCAALVWRPVVTMAVQLTASALAATIDRLGIEGSDAGLTTIVYAGVWAFGFTALLAAAAIMALRTASVLDDTHDDVLRSSAAVAAAHAGDVERSRYDAVIHDRVLTTLLATSRPDVDGRLAAEARSSLAEIDLAFGEPGVDGGVLATRFAEQLSAIVNDVGTAVTLSVTVTEPAHIYGRCVVESVAGATAEAVRNSVLHAGEHAARSVGARLAPDLVQVVVTDNGRGFDPAAVGPERLGLDVSIMRRMNSLDGGHVQIDSWPGTGTTVSIAWTETP